MPEANVQPLVSDHASRIKHLTELFPQCTSYIAEIESLLDGKPYATELTEYLIKEFISRNDPCADEIIRAVEIIRDEDSRDVVPAIKKIARALYNNKINIFFSYKLKDEAVANAVVKAMRSASSKLNITYAREFETGKDYREKILRATRNAHWFILLLPDPAEDWDWCLYESGLFRAKTFPGDRLICIHHKDSKIPDQISNFNAVAATRERLTDFLDELFCQDNPIPGMEKVNEDAMIESIAEIIASEVSPPSSLKTIPFHDFVTVKLEDDNPLESNDDLNGMTILDCTQGRLAPFGKGEKPETWGELISNIVDPDNDLWRTELRSAIGAARSKDIPNEIYATFTGSNGKHYRPILHARVQTETTGDIQSYFIDFVEDINAVAHDTIPEGQGILAAAMKLALRFRWEVLENKRYHDQVMCEGEVDEIRMSIDRIMLEASQTDLMDKELLKSQFESDEDKEQIEAMYIHWHKILNHEGSGILDEALRDRNATRVAEILEELSPLNKRFLKMVSKRFSDVLV